MQDKELDGLFKGKLDGLELEPSAHVWGNIMAELEPVRQRKPLALYYSAAAMLAVAIGTALWLQPFKKEDNNQKPGGKLIAQTESIAHPSKGKKVEEAYTAQPVEQANAEAEHSTEIQQIKTLSPSTQSQKAVVEKVSTAEQPQEVALAATRTPKQILNPVVPDTDVEFTIKPELPKKSIIDIDPVTEEAPVMAQAVQQTAKKRRSLLGSIVNTVVATIDKRDEKLVELDEENGDRLTSINLGIVKITREK